MTFLSKFTIQNLIHTLLHFTLDQLLEHQTTQKIMAHKHLPNTAGSIQLNLVELICLIQLHLTTKVVEERSQEAIDLQELSLNQDLESPNQSQGSLKFLSRVDSPAAPRKAENLDQNQSLEPTATLTPDLKIVFNLRISLDLLVEQAITASSHKKKAVCILNWPICRTGEAEREILRRKKEPILKPWRILTPTSKPKLQICPI
jgi:hypothetical protein